MSPAIARIGGDARYAEAGVGVISSEMDEALLVARVPKGQSRAAATEVAKGQDLASKPDLFEFGAQLRTEMETRLGEIEKLLSLLKFAEFSGGSIILVPLIKRVFIH